MACFTFIKGVVELLFSQSVFFPFQKLSHILIFTMRCVYLSLPTNFIISELSFVNQILIRKDELAPSFFHSFFEATFKLSPGRFLFSISMGFIIAPLTFVSVVGGLIDEDSMIDFEGITDKIASIWKDINGFEGFPVA